MTRVTDLHIQPVSVPLARAIPSANNTVIRSADALLITLHTDSGLTGEGLVFTLNGYRLPLLRDMILSLEPLVLNIDPGLSGDFCRRAWNDTTFIGQRGLPSMGVAAIDMALWDLRGKMADLNVSQLLGACHRSLPIYRSGGLRLSQSIDELQAEAADFVAQGYRAMKMSLGAATTDDDVGRVRAVREAIGPQVQLMTDCHQKFTASDAIRLGRRLEEFGLGWIEEPVAWHDHRGEASVAAALDTPIASGESEFTPLGIQDMLREKSADILMPDLQRMGGPTGLLQAARLAEAANVPVAPHLFVEMSLPLAAAMPNALMVEHMPWFGPLYDRPLEIGSDGHVAVPQGPGWGFGFDAQAVSRFAV